MRSDRSKISQNIVHAYRARAKQTAKAGQIFDRTIFMDDLSGVSCVDSCEKQQSNYREVLTDFLNADFSDLEKKKIIQSLTFEESIDTKPKKSLIAQLGVQFCDLEEIEEVIDRLTNEITYLQGHIDLEFPKTDLKAIDYATDLSKDGLKYIRENCYGLCPVDFLIGELQPHNAFNAQVVTDQSGAIVCEIPGHSTISPSFAYIIIHEIMGHVLHFTQLGSNSTLKELSPHLLCLSIHTHEKFFIEAIAQLITKFMLLKSRWSFPGKEMALLSLLKHERNLAAMHYLFGEIIEGTMSSSEAAARYISYGKIDQDAAAFAKRFDVTVSSVFETSVMMNYYPSLRAMKPILDLTESRFFGMLPQLLTTYFTPETLTEFVRENK